MDPNLETSEGSRVIGWILQSGGADAMRFRIMIAFFNSVLQASFSGMYLKTVIDL